MLDGIRFTADAGTGGVEGWEVLTSLLCVKDGQGFASPVPHQLHLCSCLLNVGPELTDGRGDPKQSNLAQGFDNAGYEGYVGPTETSGVIRVLAGTHLVNEFVQLTLGHIHRPQMDDTDNRRIPREHNIMRKLGKPWHPGTGCIMVADLVTVYGSVPVVVGAFYGYQCPMRVGVFVLGTPEEGDSDVNAWGRWSRDWTLRVHIHWAKRAKAMRGRGEETERRMTHGTGGHNRRVREVMLGRRV